MKLFCKAAYLLLTLMLCTKVMRVGSDTFKNTSSLVSSDAFHSFTPGERLGMILVNKVVQKLGYLSMQN